jgi:hypothetical protein
MDRQRRTLPGAIEGAYVAIMGQNAFLASRYVADGINRADFRPIHLAMIVISGVNFFTISTNWIESLQSNQPEAEYTKAHLFWDVMVLALLFVLSQSLVELSGKNLHLAEAKVFMITGLAYAILSALYIAWNVVELNHQRGSKTPHEVRRIIYAIRLNCIAILLAATLATASFVAESQTLVRLLFTSWFVFWAYVVIHYISVNRLITTNA